MRRHIYLLGFLLVITSCAVKEPAVSTQPLSIVPQPVHLTQGKDEFEFEENVQIVAVNDESKQVASLLQDYLKSKNVNTSIIESGGDEGSIRLNIIQADSLTREGYTLSVNNTGVSINANTGAGLFYGFQTLMQILSDDGKTVPFVEITDYPRFSYRGLHLDVGRHMFPIDFIKKYIDLLAHHKMNTFHWHLTDDQGWRIEIKKYPKLQEVAAYRKETIIGHASTATRGNGEAKYDGQRYGGFYTQEEVKDVVQYAAARHVTVIPEIEMPGHAQAALTAYPNLGCTGGPYEVATTWGVFEEVFCAGKEETFAFLQDVLDEVVPLFPGKYVHIGGDECPKTRWRKCPYCQKRIKEEKLQDEHALQSYFIQRMEKYLNGKGKQIIGWDEILEGGLAPNATVMSWRGEEGGIAAAKQNHDVVMTPGPWCYFDKYQDTTGTEPLAIGGFLPVRKVYSYEPIPPSLNEDEAKHILGAQANVWTEYIKTSDHVEYMVYPRACALAEVTWTKKENRDYDDFVRRMETHVKRLSDWKVNYARHIEKEFTSEPVEATAQ
ncbi:beta-N-acetylhexosaminidase [Chryseosolibacter indicus]|uniref:beta-N-acetylhexosaminidase n=1 Tax=Chryseosolibacter indicus TaxID=2782351 RepID=A0ABS5VM25_9BACT|nr:beta-N-acetylhexosaminidase [Chryseosolibacter indicus]MBT1702497.1 family 20 glycosylhydrolase [Chryseosolibacter indicus]